jgi:hypothetical protein
VRPLPAVALLAVHALTGLTACAPGGHRILEDGCELTDEQTVAELLGPEPHDVVLVGEPAATQVAWSERTGLFARPLDGSSEARRLGPACAGGLASSGGLIACSRPGDDAKADPGHVAVYDPGSGAVRFRAEGVGPDGHGVGLAVEGEQLAVAWSSARGTTGAVHLQRPGSDAVRLSREGVRAAHPEVLWEHVDGVAHLVVVWSETWSDRSGRVAGIVMAQRDGRPLELEPLAYDQALPSLRAGPDGEALVTFRDRRPAGTRPRLFVRRLGRSDEAMAGVHANADGEAIAMPCEGAVVLVAPRTHSRAERLVAVRRHDPVSLEGSGPEHQIYEHGAAFEHADARCVGGELLVAIASHATIERPHGEVGLVRLRCEQPAE